MSLATRPQSSKSLRPAIKAFGREYSRYYNPAKENRRVDLTEIDKSNIAHFRAYSLTRAGKDVCHHAHVDLGTGACRCECEHFSFKLARLVPTVFSPDDHLCKHLHKALGVLKRRELLPQQHGQHEAVCVRCGVVGAEVIAYDQTGNVPQGRICEACMEGELSIECDVDTPDAYGMTQADYDDIIED